MELENQNTRLAYLQVLEDTLNKKLEVLKQLMNITEQQENIISSNDFVIDRFFETISQKDEQIQVLSALDAGFEQLYKSVKEELLGGKEKYASVIMILQDKIMEITDLSVKLQAIENRNKSKLDILLATKRKEIKNSRISSKSVTNYYKAMANQQEPQSYFYDKKK